MLTQHRTARRSRVSRLVHRRVAAMMAATVAVAVSLAAMAVARWAAWAVVLQATRSSFPTFVEPQSGWKD